MTGNKIPDTVVKSCDGRITKVSKYLQQNNSENGKGIPKEKYISPEENKDIYLRKKDRKLLIIEDQLQ